MKLILLRHAKSDWDDPDQDDHDRPLNPRGRAAAPKIGAWLREHGHIPTRILCSTALRTRETLSGLALPEAETVFLHELYLAPARLILSLAQGPGTLLIVGHNPGMGEAAARATATPPDHPDFHRYPTGACTVIEPPLPGTCLAFTTPKAL